MTPDEVTLLAEANRINYRLRSTFFYRKLKEYGTLVLPGMVSQLLPVDHLYSWDDRDRWAIGEDAFAYVQGHPDLHLIEVFCHPKLLREHLRLLAYYRNIAALSQKGVGYLAGVDVKKIESDKENRYSLTDDQAMKLAALFNEHISLIVDSSIQSLTSAELRGILLSSTGAQIDGSWRNAIGEEAEKVVQRLLVKEAKARNVLAALLPRIGPGVEVYDPAKIDAQLGQIELYRGVMLHSGTSILFSSDPDVFLLDRSGRTICAIEVKGGADPAGALERYGAAKKSFEEARRINPGVMTILVASCLTMEVRNRIQQDPLISLYFNLTEILSENATAYSEFMQRVFGLAV